ncbi:MAG: dihydrolipoyl dehydrogenase [Gammaproteobacteria bacterium]|nr:dihydrolipoyl dehydrogenase [Gammaproteobacteria bacterium]MBU1655943.1 dihydrolipoyl dehydrogenase [Gammaproteobacteria bacterium]MBU1960664.1 dihydrolipoyl dehydrogenase [Gammaproteobacteria bacterium]
MEARIVDVAIIGSGSAGLYALARVRPSGKSWVLINGGEIGTTCARVGCMPSKALIQVAEDLHRHAILSRYGLEGGKDRIDIPEVMDYVRHMRDSFVGRVVANSTEKMDAEHFIPQHAHFLDPNLLELSDGRRIRARKVIIATGSTPIIPRPWQAFGDDILTTDSLFEQENLPKSMAVIGLGVIGLEIGQALSRLGIDLTGIDQLKTIGGVDDPEVARMVVEILGKEFPIWLGEAAEITREANGKLRVSAGARTVVVDKVLASLGRRPNLERLNLKALGVELDSRGIPPFNPTTMQVGQLPVFIAGDANGVRALLHEAGDEGRIAGHNAVSGTLTAFRRKTPLSINFCDPNVCQVGARWSNLDLERCAIGEVRFTPVGRAMIMGKNKGILRLYAEKKSGRLLGAEMVCPKGENLAHLLAWCIQKEMRVGELLRMPFYHPVIEEALQAALYDLYEKVEAKNEGPIAELAAIS